VVVLPVRRRNGKTAVNFPHQKSDAQRVATAARGINSLYVAFSVACFLSIISTLPGLPVLTAEEVTTTSNSQSHAVSGGPPGKRWRRRFCRRSVVSLSFRSTRSRGIQVQQHLGYAVIPAPPIPTKSNMLYALIHSFRG